VDDAVDALQRSGKSAIVYDVTDQELRFGGQERGVPVAAMDLVDEAVEDANTVAPLQESAGDMASDESGTAGNQHRLVQAICSVTVLRNQQ
jgi:hypothetical protein